MRGVSRGRRSPRHGSADQDRSRQETAVVDVRGMPFVALPTLQRLLVWGDGGVVASGPVLDARGLFLGRLPDFPQSVRGRRAGRAICAMFRRYAYGISRALERAGDRRRPQQALAIACDPKWPTADFFNRFLTTSRHRDSVSPLTAVTGIAGVLFGVIVGNILGVSQSGAGQPPVAGASPAASAPAALVTEHELQGATSSRRIRRTSGRTRSWQTGSTTSAGTPRRFPTTSGRSRVIRRTSA